MRVEIVGNKKTKKQTILRIAELRGACTPVEGVNAGAIKQRLLDSHLFSSVDVEILDEPETLLVRIVLKERWTILPIPIFSTNSSETGGGLFLLEANLLGRNKLVLIGASFSNLGEKYEGVYYDDAVWGSRWVFLLRPLFSDREIERFEDNEKVYVYRRKYNMILAVMGRRITDSLTPGVGFKWFSRETETVEGYAPPPEGGLVNSIVLNLKFDNTRYTEYYNRGLQSIFIFEHSAPWEGSERIVSKFGVNTDFTWPVWRLLSRSYFTGGWTWGEDMDFLDFYRTGGDVGSRGLPKRGIWVSDFVSLSEEIEYPLLHHDKGTLTSVVFGDCMFTGEGDPVRTYPSTGMGLRVYLVKLAIPAVGADVAYDLRDYAWRLSAYVGRTF